MVRKEGGREETVGGKEEGRMEKGGERKGRGRLGPPTSGPATPRCLKKSLQTAGHSQVG